MTSRSEALETYTNLTVGHPEALDVLRNRRVGSRMKGGRL